MDSNPGMIQGFIPLIFMVGVFYLIVFKPQMKAQKETQQMLKDLKKNDEVVTTGGIIGTVVNVKPETLTLRVDDNVRLEIERSAITRLHKPKAQKQEAAA